MYPTLVNGAVPKRHVLLNNSNRGRHGLYSFELLIREIPEQHKLWS